MKYFLTVAAAICLPAFVHSNTETATQPAQCTLSSCQSEAAATGQSTSSCCQTFYTACPCNYDLQCERPVSDPTGWECNCDSSKQPTSDSNVYWGSSCIDNACVSGGGINLANGICLSQGTESAPDAQVTCNAGYVTLGDKYCNRNMGTYCDDNANPCKNGGSCQNMGNSAGYVCLCLSGYSGTTCQDISGDGTQIAVVVPMATSIACADSTDTSKVMCSLENANSDNRCNEVVAFITSINTIIAGLAQTGSRVDTNYLTYCESSNYKFVLRSNYNPIARKKRSTVDFSATLTAAINAETSNTGSLAGLSISNDADNTLGTSVPTVDQCALDSNNYPNGCIMGDCNSSDGTCSCVTGYDGTKCDVGFCDLDSNNYAGGCAHGTCTESDGACVCSADYAGTKCDLQKCDAASGYSCHRDTDTCTFSSNPRGYDCTCNQGSDNGIYYGPTCNVNACDQVPLNADNTESCVSNGKPSVTRPTIVCKQGFFSKPGSGKFCDNEVCPSGYCGAHGTCSVTSDNTANCTCGADLMGEIFGGERCDYDSCSRGANYGKTDLQICGHGTCKSNGTPGDFECICNSGWALKTNSLGVEKCRKDFDECAIDSTNDCPADSTCINLKIKFFPYKGYKCQCGPNNKHAANYADSDIRHKGLCSETFDDCDPNNCGTGGTCTNLPRTERGKRNFGCTCDSGYSKWTTPAGRERCKLDNPCWPKSDSPCQNGATCKFNFAPNDYTCTCKPGWTGQNCDVELDPCLSNPCGNGACSRSSTGTFICTCNTGYRGRTCDDLVIYQKVSPRWIASGNCVNGPYPPGNGMEKQPFGDDDELAFGLTAVLLKFLYGVNNIRFDGGYCNGAEPAGRFGLFYHTTYYTLADTSTRRKRSVTSGDQEIDIAGALAGALNNLPSDALAGSNYTTDDAASVTVDTNADTSSFNDDLGLSASTVVEFDGCSDVTSGYPGGCQNEATCVDILDSDVTTSNVTCTCVTGYEGSSCETNIDDCALNPCGGNSDCDDGVNERTCVCHTGWSGDNCDIDTLCVNQDCNSRGTCSLGACTCTHTNNYVSGDSCETVEYCKIGGANGTTTDVDCGNGSCVEGTSGYTCACSEGFFGDNCEHQNPCLRPIGPAGAKECGQNDNPVKGACTYSVSYFEIVGHIATQSCECGDGYSGDDCSIVDGCTTSPPQKNCNSENSLGCQSNACICKTGYYGDLCENTPCTGTNSTTNQCGSQYHDTSSCAISTINGTDYGICPCTFDGARTDCNYLGPACAPGVTTCNSANTASCDYTLNGNVATTVCTCITGFYGDNCEHQVTLPATTTTVATEPATQPATQPPATQPPATQPPATQPPATQPPATQPPATQPPATQPPATQPPATQPPATQPPATQPPATQPPATQPPATQPTATQAAKLATVTLSSSLSISTTWTADLANTSSPEYQNLKNDLESSLTELWTDLLSSSSGVYVESVTVDSISQSSTLNLRRKKRSTGNVDVSYTVNMAQTESNFNSSSISSTISDSDITSAISSNTGLSTLGAVSASIADATVASDFSTAGPPGTQPTTGTSPTVTSDPYAPIKPPACDTYPTQPTKNKEITLAYINEISDTLYDDFKNGSWCFKVFHERIYGSMPVGNKLVLQYANGWHTKFDDAKSNAIEAENLAVKVKNQFRDAFNTCTTGSCVINSFCTAFVESFDTFNNGHESLSAALIENCKHEGWRFTGLIDKGNTSDCEFTFVPVPFGTCPSN